MRAVVQRVSRASVKVDGEVVGRCGPGLVVLVAVHCADTAESARKMADKVLGLRIFNDEAGKMNLALKDLPPETGPGVLAISNFTIFGDTAKSRRPSFTESAPFALGQERFANFVQELRDLGAQVETGIFGAHMDVELVNDGPVTLILDT